MSIEAISKSLAVSMRHKTHKMDFETVDVWIVRALPWIAELSTLIVCSFVLRQQIL